MIALHVALTKAKSFLKESQVYSKFDFQKAAGLRLPGGWRIPYDVSLKEERVSSWLLILFVADDGEIEVEWDSIKRIDGNTALYAAAKERSIPELPPLEDVKQELTNSHKFYGIDDYIIETTEPVWIQAEQDAKRELTRYWRLVLRKRNGERAVAYAGYKLDTTDTGTARAIVDPNRRDTRPIFVSEPQVRSRYVAHQWDLGRIRFRRKTGYLTVGLKKISQGMTSSQPLSLWTIWSCISSLTESIGDLDYAGVDLHNVIIHLAGLTQAKPQFDNSDKVPTITFPRNGGSSEELTVVLHELGHALWWLLYTRTPASVCDNVHEHLLNGIQEGFCDYLAATMVAGDSKRTYVRIGHHLAARINGLPRHIGGHQPKGIPAFHDLNNHIDIHDIGLKWANFLWAIRTKLGPEDANRIILRAHLKPLLTDNAPTEPFAAYVQSLENTAGFFQILFCEWDALAREHGLII